MIKLIMFSGGLDSTYLLYDHLKKGENIWVHHIILKSPENRWREELDASRKIIEYFKRDYEFPYTENVWEFNFKYFPMDVDVIAFIGGKMALNVYKETHEKEKVILVTGRVIEDGNSNERYAYQIWKASCDRYKENIIREIEKPIRNKTKKELINELPNELIDMIFTCRRPINGQPCNKCKSCIHLNKALKP